MSFITILRTGLSAIVGLAVVSGCGAAGDGGANSLLPKNAGQLELEQRLNQFESSCSLPNGITRYEMQRGVRSAVHEFSKMSFKVVEVELTEANKLNGYTFMGFVHIGEDTAYRWRSYHQEGAPAYGSGWAEWSHWGTFINNGSPEKFLGHLLEQKDGKWTYHVSSTLGAGIVHQKLLGDLFSENPFQHPTNMTCDL